MFISSKIVPKWLTAALHESIWGREGVKISGLGEDHTTGVIWVRLTSSVDTKVTGFEKQGGKTTASLALSLPQVLTCSWRAPGPQPSMEAQVQGSGPLVPNFGCRTQSPSWGDLVTQLYLTLCSSTDCSPSGFSNAHPWPRRPCILRHCHRESLYYCGVHPSSAVTYGQVTESLKKGTQTLQFACEAQS